jgi:Capsule assembly protein Wzi
MHKAILFAGVGVAILFGPAGFSQSVSVAETDSVVMQTFPAHCPSRESLEPTFSAEATKSDPTLTNSRLSVVACGVVAVTPYGGGVHSVVQSSRHALDSIVGSKLPKQTGSVYIPVDNWLYPEMDRLYELGYVDTVFLGLRPWTRRSVLHALEASEGAIMSDGNEEAKDIFAVVLDDLRNEKDSEREYRPVIYGIQSAYSRVTEITGTPLRDSFHLGQTVVNDYGRPYEQGFNAITGISTVTEKGRFSLLFRGEYQHADGAVGYSEALSNQLSINDGIGSFTKPNAPQATIPAGLIARQDSFRIVEANLSYHTLGQEVSVGKSDAWIGPGAGASMAWSNNAENIYSFRVNRVEPLTIPILSRLTGAVRYDFFYGSLKGHTSPNRPYVHSEAFSFHPTSNLQIGFQRTIIFGGEGHSPVTLHSFLKGFFSGSGTTLAEKNSRNDPGARFSTFNASYRLPYLRHYAMIYLDSLVHDDVSPIDAPRRAGFRVGLDLSQFPIARKVGFRIEAASTDPAVSRSSAGSFLYVEAIQKQGYTNKGFIMGDWVGREAKGGQAWLTYHIAPQQMIVLEYLNKKQDKDFDGGTTQNQVKLRLVKRFYSDYEIAASIQLEKWRAPIYMNGAKRDATAGVQITWFPALKAAGLSK